ncbi:MAG: acetyl-CoA carboxylase biotin carboxyl carrier protein subunit [Fimbriimonadaceae bacterium]|nr:acetyl-CoA carboxylase biotin carboxyl carrier protein subunit [Fimbriimonadaceae bacterium]
MAEFDSELIRHALEVAREHGITEVVLDVGEVSFEAKRRPSRPRNLAGTATVAVEAAAVPTAVVVEAPCVGYFRPISPPVQVGDRVKAGATVGSIVALGLATDATTEEGGTVIEVLVQADDAVQYGQPLVRLEVGDA